jgi:hypothetical protein
MLAALLGQLLIAELSTAAPVTFKCTASDGTPVVDLVVDVEKRSMAWGDFAKYRIHSIDDRYISAYKTTDENNNAIVGGEVWVLSRITGEYMRATIFVGWPSLEAARRAHENNERGKPIAQTFTGRCARPML